MQSLDRDLYNNDSILFIVGLETDVRTNRPDAIIVHLLFYLRNLLK